jgi:hypothetical protein
VRSRDREKPWTTSSREMEMEAKENVLEMREASFMSEG